MASITEQPLQLGEGDRLLGILTLPAAVEAQRPAFIIPNTGVEHRVGPNRMHVELARSLAEAGLVTVRLDLGGLGDSDVDPVRGRTESTQDLRMAMDALSQLGIANRFVLVGLCSGAHDAHQATKADERVCGAIFLDGYAYRTPRFWVHYAAQRLFAPHRIRNALERLEKRPGTFEGGVIDVDNLEYFRVPPRETMRDDLAGFMRRGVELCFIYTGQVTMEYNYPGQLFDAFPQLRGYKKAKVHYMLRADHTFTRRETRREMAALLTQWAAQIA